MWGCLTTLFLDEVLAFHLLLGWRTGFKGQGMQRVSLTELGCTSPEASLDRMYSFKS